MAKRLYPYVGPPEIRTRSAAGPDGQRIESLNDLRRWIAAHQESVTPDGLVAATFVVNREGRLLLADRRSEHIACSGGREVLSAGEMFFSTGGRIAVVEVSNHSTGFCPEPESWPAVQATLDRLGAHHPGRFTTEITFRRCPNCGERNVVKDDWFVCQLCGHGLPAEWNFV